MRDTNFQNPMPTKHTKDAKPKGMCLPDFVFLVRLVDSIKTRTSDMNLKLACFPRSLAATRRGFTFYVADPSAPFTNSH